MNISWFKLLGHNNCSVESRRKCIINTSENHQIIKRQLQWSARILWENFPWIRCPRSISVAISAPTRWTSNCTSFKTFSALLFKTSSYHNIKITVCCLRRLPLRRQQSKTVKMVGAWGVIFESKPTKNQEWCKDNFPMADLLVSQSDSLYGLFDFENKTLC